MRFGKIDVTKIKKEHLFKGTKGTYLDITLVENKTGRDEFGNDGFISQSVSKEAREKGEKGPIIGNWKRAKEKVATTPAPAASNDGQPVDDDVPF